MRTDDLLPIGDVSHRGGLAPSALRYYEDCGLIVSARTAGNQRRYPRSTLRRLAVIRSAQHVGLSLEEIASAMADIPLDRAPTKREWRVMSARWRDILDARIADLTALRANLDLCIGCGCLSMRQCAIYNPEDELGTAGTGPRRKVAVLDGPD